MTIFGKLSFAALVAVGLSACASDPAPIAATDASAGAGAGGAGGAYGAGALDPRSIEYFNVSVGDRVFFATDSSSLDDAARATLAAQARWLQENGNPSLTIEGHADERGTRAYNLALGARRAQAARDFLTAQGIDASQLRTVSLGKERPVALCSDESCWSQNRRAVTVVAGAPTS